MNDDDNPPRPLIRIAIVHGQFESIHPSRQSGQSAEVIAYADKANTRLRSKYDRMIRHGKKRNVAVAAVARELDCFVWGTVIDSIGIVSGGTGTSETAVSQE